MPARAAYEYAILRIVPRIEREEFINAGVILFCKRHKFLRARVYLDEARLLALDSAADVACIREQLALVPLIAMGGKEAGEIGQLPQAERFRWLASPRNTVLQPSPVHPGLCGDPESAMDALFARMVRGQAGSSISE